MDFSKKKVSLNFRSIWKRKQMNLTDVTQETGTSKSILCQIGLDEANPTIGTVGKLVGRLRIDCMNLIASPQDEGYLVSRKLLSPGEAGQEPHQSDVCFPYEQRQYFKIHNISIEPWKLLPLRFTRGANKEYLVVSNEKLLLDLG